MNRITNKNVSFKPTEIRIAKWLMLVFAGFWIIAFNNEWGKQDIPPLILVFLVTPFFIPIYAIFTVLAMRLITKSRHNKTSS